MKFDAEQLKAIERINMILMKFKFYEIRRNTCHLN